MTKLQKLAISLGWDRDKAIKCKQYDNEFNRYGIKKNRRINETFQYNHDMFYKRSVSQINSIIKGGEEK